MPFPLLAPLHDEVVAMIDAQQAAGARPRSSLTIAETREAMVAGRAWQLPPVDCPVRDAVANGVPVRLYGPLSATTLLYAHGGRFFSGNLESHDWPLRMLSVAAGRRVCAVDYRLAPEYRHPAAVEDVIRAGEWLAGECDQMIIGGDSAGGYLAALGSLALRPVWQLLLYPMLDPGCGTASYGEFRQGPWPSGEDMQRGWDLYGGEAVTAESGSFPRTVLVTAGTDALRDEALDFAEGLRRKGTPVELHHYADMHHGFFTQTRLQRSRELMALVASEFART